MSHIDLILEAQREYFNQGETLDVDFRIKQLKKLKSTIELYQNDIELALYEDLNKSSFEAYMCEIGLVLDGISYMLKHVRQFSKDKTVKTPLAQFASHSYEKKVPYGNVLIISPWNYPFLLTLEPLVEAISAGNTAIIKPSAYSPKTSGIIKKIIDTTFEEKYIACVKGGRKENQELLEKKFDFIFFTGSQNVGKVVLRHAAEHLTPAVLELGGKSPCIVDESADISLAAKRIVFGKFINCGQTCIAPDYILCHETIKDKLTQELIKQMSIQYTNKPLENKNYGKIINEKHFERLIHLIDQDKVVHGGKWNIDTLKIEPTLMKDVSFEDKVMQEEIFGPILPMMTYKDLNDVIKQLQSLDKPLALYYFSTNKMNIEKVTSQIRYGGGCINDCIIHLATHNLGFGGVGESGMGAYHGKIGFDTFSHTKSIVDKKNWIDLPMRYQPYQKKFKKIVEMFLK